MGVPGFEAFSNLVGARLVAVTFILDYIQLQFEGGNESKSGHSMNLWTNPRIQSGGQNFAWGEPGYRDAVCDRIGSHVRRADTDSDSEQIVMEFDDGSVFTVSLRPDDFCGPEAAEYVWELGSEKRWVIWRTDWKE